MLKQLFKNGGIEVTDQELKEILQITTDDIRENRIRFGKRTGLEQVITIAIRAYGVMKKVAWKKAIKIDNNLERKAEKAVKLYFDGYSAKEAIEKVRYDLDGDELYDMENGHTVNNIDTATDTQIKNLLEG